MFTSLEIEDPTKENMILGRNPWLHHVHLHHTPNAVQRKWRNTNIAWIQCHRKSWENKVGCAFGSLALEFIPRAYSQSLSHDWIWLHDNGRLKTDFPYLKCIVLLSWCVPSNWFEYYFSYCISILYISEIHIKVYISLFKENIWKLS